MEPFRHAIARSPHCGVSRAIGSDSHCPRESNPPCDTHKKKPPKRGIFLWCCSFECKFPLFQRDPFATQSLIHHIVASRELSARTHVAPVSLILLVTRIKKKPQNWDFFYGAASENRTHDPSLTKGVLYH